MIGDIEENKEAMQYILDFQKIMDSFEIAMWQSRYDECMEMIRKRTTLQEPNFQFNELK